MIGDKIVRIGNFLEKLGRNVRYFGESLYGQAFLSRVAIQINKARLEHLASLNLELTGKSVLEVGAGIGLLTKFFENRNCFILSTDAREVNLKEMAQRFPGRKIRKLDLDLETNLTGLGMFEVVFCYGTLYHLSKPETALKSLSVICSQIILLETCVAPWSHEELILVKETPQNNQAHSGIGCRPTRSWIMAMLRKYFGYAYISKFQPNHEDFRTDWNLPYDGLGYRAVFVGSKQPLKNDKLLDYIPQEQIVFKD
jgi:hypothetical protein